YACEGTGPNGQDYHGTVEIVRHENTYTIRWDFSSDEEYVGIGLINGDIFAVSYFGSVPGVVAYRIEQGEKGPRLVGQWTVVESPGRVFVETLTRMTTDVSDPLPARPRPSRSIKPSGRAV